VLLGAGEGELVGGELVGLGVLDVLGDGVILAVGVGVVVEVHGVLLDAFLDAEWGRTYSDMFSFET
jgi:hypothetical protein